MVTKDKFLKDVEMYLSDLPSETRINLMGQVLTDVENNNSLLAEDPLNFTNKLRSRINYPNYKPIKKKAGFFAWIGRIFMLGWVFIFIGLFTLWFQFTPIFKIDEEAQRMIILGGLIDIDGKAGKIKVFNEIKFATNNANLKDSFQMNMALSSDIDEIIVIFKSGQFTLKNSVTNELKFNCKISQEFDQKMIEQGAEVTRVDFSEIDGTTCEIQVPEDKRLTLEGIDSSINVIRPEFNLYIEVENAHVAIVPQPEHDYLFDLEVKQGYVGDFKSSESDSATEIQVRLKNGAVVTK